MKTRKPEARRPREVIEAEMDALVRAHAKASIEMGREFRRLEWELKPQAPVVCISDGRKTG